MKINELHKLQKEYLKGVKSFFTNVEKELRKKVDYKLTFVEIKAKSDELWADYEIDVNGTKFMLDCSPYEDYFRLAVFEGTKLADELIESCKGEYDNIFENYVLFLTEDLNDIIEFFKEIKNEK